MPCRLPSRFSESDQRCSQRGNRRGSTPRRSHPIKTAFIIVVGRQNRTNDEEGLWSAAFSAGEQPSDDVPSP
jgi:hypothetical protein